MDIMENLLFDRFVSEKLQKNRFIWLFTTSFLDQFANSFS